MFTDRKRRYKNFNVWASTSLDCFDDIQFWERQDFYEVYRQTSVDGRTVPNYLSARCIGISKRWDYSGQDMLEIAEVTVEGSCEYPAHFLVFIDQNMHIGLINTNEMTSQDDKCREACIALQAPSLPSVILLFEQVLRVPK